MAHKAATWVRAAAHGIFKSSSAGLSVSPSCLPFGWGIWRLLSSKMTTDTRYRLPEAVQIVYVGRDIYPLIIIAGKDPVF